jgi:TolB-like protein/Tfp pilus assembly protein PilF
MKRCPQCNRVETDDSLGFCRADGTALVNDSGPVGADAGTVKFGSAPISSEIETGLLPHTSTTPEINRATWPTTVLPAQPSGKTRALAKPKRRKIAIGVIVTAVMAAVGAMIVDSYLSRNHGRSIESIAVMPFVNESGNTDVEYLSDGMTETLIKSLSRLPNLNVKARSSVFRYKGKQANLQTIGKELNVQGILNGRVVQRGDQLTLSLELIDAQSENVMWSEQYIRRQADLVALQSEIARDVSNQLRTRLSGADEQKITKSFTANSEAYQLYLKGRYHWNKRTYEDLRKAIEHFRAAIAKDDRFALAYSGLADSYSILPYYTGSKSSEFTGQAKPYAIRAVEIDEQLAEVHTSLAFVNEGSWNWAEAEKEYKRAIEINPDYSTAQMRYARFEVRVPGRDVEGLARIKRALELEPSSLVINDNLSQIYLSQGSADLALEQAKRTVELDPSYSFGWVDLAYAYVKKDNNAEALASARKVAEATKRSSRSLVCLGFINALSGRRDLAIAILKELEAKYSNGQSDATEVAAVYAGLENRDQVFAWLNKAFADRSSLLVDVRVEFPFASLHDDPRYMDLLTRMGLPN